MNSRGPLERRNTDQLKSELAKGELAPRKKAFVQEILRRRKEGNGVQKYAWLGVILAAFGILGAALKRMARSKPDSQIMNDDY
jgi:hypothetical protein